MSRLGRLLILKYCSDRSLFNLLKSKSKLTHVVLEKLKAITFKYSLLSYHKQLENYCRENNRILLAHLINLTTSLMWDFGLNGACQGGHRELIDLIIFKGSANWDWGLRGACRGGHLDIVNSMIAKGATDWEGGFYRACLGGNRKIVDLMIYKRVDYWILVNHIIGGGLSGSPPDNFWNKGLMNACQGAHREIIELMIKKGATSWNWGLKGACKGGHREIIELMINKGATNWNGGLEGACQGGHRELVDLMINKGATKCWNCKKHQFKIDSYFVDLYRLYFNVKIR